MSHFSAAAFVIVDAIAVMISVPTQILLIYHFGEPILSTLYKFKTYLAIAIGILIIYAIVHKLWVRFRNADEPSA
jgi:membrane protein DedA with SNARE-associated domain